MIYRKNAPSLNDLPVFLAMSELFYSDFMYFSGSQFHDTAEIRSFSPPMEP